MSSDVLISAQELAELLRSDQPPLIADVRWNLGGPPGKPDFEAGHIPGAVWVDLETQLAGPPGVGGRHPLPTVAIFEDAMRSIGVCQDSLVVAHDAANSQAAARLWWLLTDAGHGDVKVLDGGFAAWRAAGLPAVSGPNVRAARGDFIAHPGQRPQLTATEISARLGRPDAPTLIDVRTSERYAGENEPLDPVAGHIPGAINLPWAGNVRADGRFRPPAEIARRTPKRAATGTKCFIAAQASPPHTACCPWSLPGWARPLFTRAPGVTGSRTQAARLQRGPLPDNERPRVTSCDVWARRT